MLAGIEVDSDYEYKALSNTVDDKANAKSKERLLTGNDMLDTLSYGNPDSSINKLVSQLPDDRVSNTRGASYSIKPEARVIDIQADKELETNKSQSVRRLPGQSLEDAMAASNPNKDNTNNMRSSRRAGIEALEERLKSASDMQADLSK